MLNFITVSLPDDLSGFLYDVFLFQCSKKFGIFEEILVFVKIDRVRTMIFKIKMRRYLKAQQCR